MHTPGFLKATAPCPYTRILYWAYQLAASAAAHHALDEQDCLDSAMDIICTRLEAFDAAKGNFQTYVSPRLRYHLHYDFPASQHSHAQRHQEMLVASQMRTKEATHEEEQAEWLALAFRRATPAQKRIMQAYLDTESDTAAAAQICGVSRATLYVHLSNLGKRCEKRTERQRCRYGHRYVQGTGKKICLECRRASSRNYERRKAATTKP